MGWRSFRFFVDPCTASPGGRPEQERYRRFRETVAGNDAGVELCILTILTIKMGAWEGAGTVALCFGSVEVVKGDARSTRQLDSGGQGCDPGPPIGGSHLLPQGPAPVTNHLSSAGINLKLSGCYDRNTNERRNDHGPSECGTTSANPSFIAGLK